MTATNMCSNFGGFLFKPTQKMILAMGIVNISPQKNVPLYGSPIFTQREGLDKLKSLMYISKCASIHWLVLPQPFVGHRRILV